MAVWVRVDERSEGLSAGDHGRDDISTAGRAPADEPRQWSAKLTESTAIVAGKVHRLVSEYRRRDSNPDWIGPTVFESGVVMNRSLSKTLRLTLLIDRQLALRIDEIGGNGRSC